MREKAKKGKLGPNWGGQGRNTKSKYLNYFVGSRECFSKRATSVVCFRKMLLNTAWLVGDIDYLSQ